MVFYLESQSHSALRTTAHQTGGEGVYCRGPPGVGAEGAGVGFRCDSLPLNDDYSGFDNCAASEPVVVVVRTQASTELGDYRILAIVALVGDYRNLVNVAPGDYHTQVTVEFADYHILVNVVPVYYCTPATVARADYHTSYLLESVVDHTTSRDGSVVRCCTDVVADGSVVGTVGAGLAVETAD